MGADAPPPGAMLIFEDGAWRGETATHRVVLTEEALQREIGLYLRGQGITEPTSEEQSRALRTVRQVSYWPDHYDPTQGDVHIWPSQRSYNDSTGWH